MTQPTLPQYGANCPISMPVPIEADPGEKADMGGFAFITTGLVHDLTSSDRDALVAQGYAPAGGIRGA